MILSNLGSVSFHLGDSDYYLGCSPLKGSFLYKALLRKATNLMGLESYVNMTFWLVKFWFILVTLVIHGHPVLTAYSMSSSTVFSFLSLRTFFKQASSYGSNSGALARILSGVFQRPTAHCHPSG